MPVVEDPDSRAGRLLLDAAGAPVARFELGEREGRPLASLLAPVEHVGEERAVAAAMTELRGWSIAVGEPFGRRLLSAGARPLRHSHAMSRDLTRDPAPGGWLEPELPAGIRLTAVNRPASDLVPAYRAAFPPGHPDHRGVDHDAETEIGDLLTGRLMGPLLGCSALALGEDNRVTGAILVNGRPGEPPLDGPWISNIFRDPSARGVGGALLKRALGLATRDRLPAVGLAVTHTNPALARYSEYGFVEVSNVLTVGVPD
jgi:GNAT superfamily N-acetyltransferase